METNFPFVKEEFLKAPDSQFGVKIVHDQRPDQIIEHRPAMTWLELVSSCGGLLGMWLGLSFAFILEHMYQMAIKTVIYN